MGTNGAVQYGLMTIQSLGMVGDALPTEKKNGPPTNAAVSGNRDMDAQASFDKNRPLPTLCKMMLRDRPVF